MYTLRCFISYSHRTKCSVVLLSDRLTVGPFVADVLRNPRGRRSVGRIAVSLDERQAKTEKQEDKNQKSRTHLLNVQHSTHYFLSAIY